MTAREELEKATSRCKISRRRRSLHAQRVEGRVSTREANTSRLDDAGDKKPEARTRTEDCLRAGEDAWAAELASEWMTGRADPRDR